jgi:hypothetical protein
MGINLNQKQGGEPPVGEFPQFGTITMAMHPGREAQFSARLTF